VGPEQAPQRILPPARLAEHLHEPLLLRCFIVPPCCGDPDLGVEGDGADRLLLQVFDAQLEEETRDGGKLENFGALDPEIQIRHGMPSEFRLWFSSSEYQSSSFCIPLQGA
jgi:hypothetical protein